MPSDDTAIGFEQVGIGDVLNRYRLRVPPNQRDYAWDKAQVENLLQDVEFALSNDEPQHFLGSLVTIRAGANNLEVTDGQQRLATTALLLAAMREIVGDDHQNLSTLLSTFLSSIDSDTLEEAPNLTLNVADTSVFLSLIVSGEVGDGFVENRTSHKLLKQAYQMAKQHFQARISVLAPQEKWTIFRNWINYLQQKTKVILLIVSDAANSFRMFETLNDRGLKVSQSDLIKNYIFGQSGDNVEAAQQYWSSIRGSLEAIDDEDIMMNFIRHSLMVTGGFLQQKNIYDKIQQTTRGPQSSVSLLATWEALSSDYVALSNPESSVWNGFPNKIRDNIKVLNLFDIAPLRPMLLATTKKLSTAETAATFEKVVVIGVRLIIASRTTTQSVEKPLGDCAQKIWSGEISTAQEIVTELASAIPNDQQFKEAFERTTVSKAQFARYYLRSLERVAKDEPDPWLIPNDDANVITLEHVLPKNPEDNWPDWDEESVRAYHKRIGNMVLLTAQTNSTLKSASFDEKRPHFERSPYEITSMVAANETWTPEAISSRQSQLAELCLRAWPLR